MSFGLIEAMTKYMVSNRALTLRDEAKHFSISPQSKRLLEAHVKRSEDGGL